MTVRERDLVTGLRDLGLGKAPVVVHASLSAFGMVEGGAETVVRALTTVFPTLLAPAFTYKTMVIPETGPADNGITYGSGVAQNRMAEFFTPSMPVDPLIGIIPETLRRLPGARRSGHPILSFVGINADEFLAAQTLDAPYGPLGALEQAGGWVVLMGVNHTTNTSIHYAEKLAGRRTFVRWALTQQGVVECRNFPGCSGGFEEIVLKMYPFSHMVRIGNAKVLTMPMNVLFREVVAVVKRDPLALLCDEPDCERCNQMRELAKT